MATACIAQVAFRFEPKGRPVVARFDIPDASSDGGLVLLKSIDTQLGLTKRLAACVDDERQPAKVRHETIELRQRVFGLAAGYADCNDRRPHPGHAPQGTALRATRRGPGLSRPLGHPLG
jgi:hypothetical protein